MMKMKIAAVLAAVMIGSAALPAMTAFAYGNDPAQTTAAETTPVETESVEETSADTVTAETEVKDSVGDETKTVADGEEAADSEASETGEIDLSSLDLSQIPGIDASLFTDILSDMDPEVVEVLLKNPKLLAYFLPTLHVTVTDTSVTIAVDGDEPEKNPVRTGHVRTNGSNLNVRTGPGIDFDIINKLANGTEVQRGKRLVPAGVPGKIRLCMRPVSGAERHYTGGNAGGLHFRYRRGNDGKLPVSLLWNV